MSPGRRSRADRCRLDVQPPRYVRKRCSVEAYRLNCVALRRHSRTIACDRLPTAVTESRVKGQWDLPIDGRPRQRRIVLAPGARARGNAFRQSERIHLGLCSGRRWGCRRHRRRGCGSAPTRWISTSAMLGGLWSWSKPSAGVLHSRIFRGRVLRARADNDAARSERPGSPHRILASRCCGFSGR